MSRPKMRDLGQLSVPMTRHKTQTAPRRQKLKQESDLLELVMVDELYGGCTSDVSAELWESAHVARREKAAYTVYPKQYARSLALA